MGSDVSKFIEAEANTRRLNLAQKRITEIPSDIERFQEHLQRLELNHNLLHSLPSEMAMLSNLRFLNLRGNFFREFPLILCSLPNLEILDIGRNKIRTLPEDFGQLMSLKILSIANNRICQLPQYIGDMKQLRILKIHHNPLSWPPSHIIEPVQDADGSAWLDQLKQYLRENSNTTVDTTTEKQASQVSSDSEGSDDVSNSNYPLNNRPQQSTSRHKASRDNLTTFIESARLEQASSTTGANTNTNTSDDGSCGGGNSSSKTKTLTHQRSRPSNGSSEHVHTPSSSVAMSPILTTPLDEEIDDYPETPVFIRGTMRHRQKSRDNVGGAAGNFHIRGSSTDALLASSAAVHARRPSIDASSSQIATAAHQRQSSSETLSSINNNSSNINNNSSSSSGITLHSHRLSREIINMAASKHSNGSISRLHNRYRSAELAQSEGKQHNRDDSMDSLGSLDSQLTHITTASVDRGQATAPSVYSLSGSGNSVVSGGTNNFSCERAVETYFQRITGTAEVDLASESGRWLDAGRCMLFALSQAYTTLRVLVAAQPDTQATLILSGTLKVLNDHVHQLVRCLVGFDRHVHQLRHQSSQRLEPGVCAELKRHCLASVAATRKLTQTLRLHGQTLMRGVDIRLIRQALLSFHGVSYEIRLAAERLPCAAAMPPLARNPHNATAAPASLLGNVPLGLVRGLARSSMRRTATAPSDSSNNRTIDVFTANNSTNHSNGNGMSSSLSTTGGSSTPIALNTPSSITSFSPNLLPTTSISASDITRSATIGVTTTTPMPIMQPLTGHAMLARRPTAPDIRSHIPSNAPNQLNQLNLPDTPTTPIINLPDTQQDLERDTRLIQTTSACVNATSTATEQIRHVVAHYSRVDQNGSGNSDRRGTSSPRKDSTSSPLLNDATPSTRSLPRSGHLSVEKINELNRHLQIVCELLPRIQRSLNAFQSYTTELTYRRALLEDISAFLRAVTRLSTAAKGVSLIFSLSRSATMSLQSMIQSTRDLTLLMATISGRMSPRPLLRNNTLPSGRTSPLPPGSSNATLEPIPSINVNGP
ncbi:hypothetical protein BDF22DRAFT_739360 [Syncephalis plumigaleata]|nr:hypothetical protein BDF22DRAFT_739360 [Syncephalis plumigaleata]